MRAAILVMVVGLARVAHADGAGGFDLSLGTRVGSVEDKSTYGDTERVYSVQSITWAEFGDDSKAPGLTFGFELEFGRGSGGGAFFNTGGMVGYTKRRSSYGYRAYGWIGGNTLQDRQELGMRAALGAELMLITHPARLILMGEYGGRVHTDQNGPIDMRMSTTGPASRARASLVLRHMQGESEEGVFIGPLISVEYQQSFDARIVWVTFGTSIDYRKQ